MELTRELFIEILEAIEKQEDQNMVFSEFVAVMCDDDQALVQYKNYLKGPIVRLLEIATNDYPCLDGHCIGMIRYFINKADFGRKYCPKQVMFDFGVSLDLSDAGKLWDYLINKKNNQ